MHGRANAACIGALSPIRDCLRVCGATNFPKSIVGRCNYRFVSQHYNPRLISGKVLPSIKSAGDSRRDIVAQKLPLVYVVEASPFLIVAGTVMSDSPTGGLMIKTFSSELDMV